MLNDPSNPNNLTENEVQIAMMLGIKFRNIMLDPQHVRIETLNPIRFQYEVDRIEVKEFFDDGEVKIYKINLC